MARTRCRKTLIQSFLLQFLLEEAHQGRHVLLDGIPDNAQVYPVVIGMSEIGLAIPFAFGCLMMIIQFFVVRLFFIETKGISLEDMEKKLGIAPGAINS